MRAIRLLYLRELRSALRERNLVVYSILIPLLLYPAMVWLATTGITFVTGQTEKKVSRIEVVGADDDAAALVDRLQEQEKIEVRSAANVESAKSRLRDEEVELVVVFRGPENPDAVVEGNFVAEVFFDGSNSYSVTAKERLDRQLADYRGDWLQSQAKAQGIDAATWRVYEIERENEASGREMGAFLLGAVVPITIIVMVTMGGMYPAVDAIAGERERSTWETSLTLGARHSEVVIAKYLYVTTMATIAGILNMIGISVSLSALIASIAGPSAGVEIAIPWQASPIILIGIVLIALLVAAGMMIVAAFARTFREGQSMASPLFMLVFIPAMITALPEEAISLVYAAVPGVNVLLMLKQSISGDVDWVFAAICLGSMVITVAACLRLALSLLENEQLVLGSFSGSGGEFMRRMLRPKKNRKDRRK